MNSHAPYYRPENVAARQSGGLEVVNDGRDLPQVVDGFSMKPMESGYYGAVAAPSEKKIFGLRRATFIMAMIMIIVVIVAAVGGGVAGSMAVSSAYDRGFGDAQSELAFEAPTESSSPQSDDSREDAEDAHETDEATPTQSGRMELPPTRGKLPLDCPRFNGGTNEVAPRTELYTFRSTCGADSGPGEGDMNIMTLTAYRYGDCLRACASLNDRGNVGDGKVCGAVRFHTDLGFVETHGGNCWLKKGVDKLVYDTNDKTKNDHVFGVLQD